MSQDTTRRPPMRRRYFLRGIGVTCGMLLCVALIYLVYLGFSYDGKCPVFFYTVSRSPPKACTFWEYVSEDMHMMALLMGAAYWPFVLALLVLPPFVGYLLDRRG